MAKIAINLLRWNTSWEEVQRCIVAVLNSDFSDFTLIYTENPHVSAPSLVGEVRRKFGCDARVRTVRNDSNIGYAGAHNRFFEENASELLMVLNPDAVISPSFLQNIVKAFSDLKVAAAAGKMLKPQASVGETRILDGTGIEIHRSRRARERGQLEVDCGQYDKGLEVFGVSGTAAVYRKSALEKVRLGTTEYFDEDFFAYWEDFDLSWRLRLCGFECIYVPEAIVIHGRAAGVSSGGVRQFRIFIDHHRSFPLQIRLWNWRNHLFSILKNDFGWCFYRDLPKIFVRECGVFLFMLFFTPNTFPAAFGALRLLPRMIRKRSLIQSSRKIGSSEISKFFG
jgi:GT2 family glycosyltransferase